VVEHIKDDRLAIANCKKLLKKNGHLIILVPAYRYLYNEFDKELEYYRRYNKNAQ
jgi:2-polyprenyl-3-methyl-5-hydroxy-6-metoxy-1,4-benzoquinol methylase